MSEQDKKINLFSEFPPVSREQWEEVIERDLKGADRERKIVWHTPEGLKFEPYYRREDLADISHEPALPGEFPFVRGNKTNSNGWELRQEIEKADAAKANKEAVNAITRGAEAIVFDVREISNAEQMELLLKDIDPVSTPVQLTNSTNYKMTVNLFLEALKNKGVDAKQAHGSLDFDPVGYFVLKGEFYNSWEDNLSELICLIDKIEEELPNFSILNINGRFFHNGGATIVQELAYSLAVANEYLAALTDAGKELKDITPKMQFSFAIGSNYFMEIAKIRAARMLWANMVRQYTDDKEAGKVFIHVETSTWNKTIYDPYVNMLRNTTEAMSGAIAGCDSMSVRPFDYFFRSPNDMSKRVARNTQIILKEESHFNKTVDPSAGSYYIEKLTASIAEAAWKLFVETEAKCGFIKAFENGDVKADIEETVKNREEAIARRKTSYIGTNQFPNAEEEMLDELKKEIMFRVDQKDIKGLPQYRGAEPFEKLRLATEKYIKDQNKKPGVYLLKIGNRAMRTARASFSSAFFGCAGYDIFDNLGFDNTKDAVTDAMKSKAEIIVICSSDDDYVEYVPELAKMIKTEDNKKNVIVAGYPKEHIDSFKQAGVDDFVHVKSNLLDTITAYQKKLGVIK
ncbi:MAG: methylmalonyl-CoA mutase small subunit [Bacteroidales bacterium]|nr:methylmalonyl-CoA mutase small subunit [Bacteroidales bacterium]